MLTFRSFATCTRAIGIAFLLTGCPVGAIAGDPRAGVTIAASAGQSAPQSHHLVFHRAVLNMEVARELLSRSAPPGVTPVAGIAGDVYFGTIKRWTRPDSGQTKESPVAFEVEYSGDAPVRAWCDANLDGRLDDAPVKLWNYPEPKGSRSFLVDLEWSSQVGAARVPVSWMVRIALAPIERKDSAPEYRVQRVEGMSGTMAIDGRTHQAFLFDGNDDGVYTRDTGDGLFVDLDDNGRPTIDLFSHDFGPLAVPFQMGSRIYRAEEIDPGGAALTLLDVGAAEASSLPVRGAPAPLFSYQDVEGRQVRLEDYRGRWVLVYFWASWCPTTRGLAPGMRDLYGRFNSRGVDIIGVSFDKDFSAMEAFRQKAELIWPTSFSGRSFYEDPIGKLYQVREVPAVFLVDPAGRLEGNYPDPSALSEHLETLLEPHE